MYILNLYNVTGQLYLNFEMWLIHKIEYYLERNSDTFYNMEEP